MVSRCANPACAVPLRYLRDGRLYQFEVRQVSASGTNQFANLFEAKRPGRQVWHYWLCGKCCSSMTLVFNQISGVQVISLLQPSPSSRVPTALPA